MNNDPRVPIDESKRTDAVRVHFDFTDAELDLIQRFAVIHGYLRETPDKAWTVREKREVARYWITRIVEKAIGR